MTLRSFVTRALAAPLGWLAPRTCVACDGPLGDARVFCAACDAGHTPLWEDVAGVPLCAAGPYRPPLAPAIQRFKYGGRTDLAVQLAELVAGAAAERRSLAHLDRPLLVPVPLHPLKLAARGYNQSVLLGREVAGRLGLGWAPVALARIRHTAAQAGQNKSQRSTQLDGAFVVRDPRAIAGCQVVLIDDVVTTGATSQACACAVRAAGASLDLVLSLARTS